MFTPQFLSVAGTENPTQIGFVRKGNLFLYLLRFSFGRLVNETDKRQVNKRKNILITYYVGEFTQKNVNHRGD